MNTDNRTDDELNKVIAEWCGYKTGYRDPEAWHPLPDYCHDLNAVHWAVKARCGDNLILDYAAKAWEIVNPDISIDDCKDGHMLAYLHANARQRAEALVRVIETSAPSA